MSEPLLVVWKQKLGLGLNDYELPMGARLLSIGWQQDAVALWFLCSPKETEREVRSILLTGTGHEFPNKHYIFLGTVLTDDQSLVFHAFERRLSPKYITRA